MDHKVLQLSCPNCDHELEYLPASDQLTCTSCGYLTQIDGSQKAGLHLAENPYTQAKTEKELYYELVGVKCQKCSGTFQLSAFTLSLDCPYCGTNTVVDVANRAHSIKPTGIVPFKVTQKEIWTRLEKDIKRNPFVPEKLFSYFNPSNINGLYVPAYSFDYHVKADYTGERGTNYTTTDSKGNRQTHTRWHTVSGTVNVSLDDVQFIKSRHADAVGFRSNQNASMVPFDERYLSGFLAEGHSHTLAECYHISKELGKDKVESAIRADIGGDHQRISHYDAEYSRVHYRHYLFPMWVGNYTFKDKSRLFVASGLNTDMQMEVPLSGLSVFIYFVVIVVGFAILNGVCLAIFGEGLGDDGQSISSSSLILWSSIALAYFYYFFYDYPNKYGVYSGVAKAGPQSLDGISKTGFENLKKVNDIKLGKPKENAEDQGGPTALQKQ